MSSHKAHQRAWALSRLAAIAGALLLSSAPGAFAADCEPTWQPNFGDQPGVNGRVNALAVHDDGLGDGPALCAGGLFTTAGDVAMNYVGKWNGSDWSPLGGGVNNEVYVLHSFDDGTGPALYAGGVFSTADGQVVNRIARWDGAAWSPLGTGLNSSPLAMVHYDDGSGSALYVGGQFTMADGVAVNRIAKWDGAQWSPLGAGMNAEVRALAVFDDGSGPALYAGGVFTTAGGVTISRIAKWDGEAWSSLASGLGGTTNASVEDMVVFDDGSGPALYVGGAFTTDGVSTLNRIAKWDGEAWSPLAGGLSSTALTLALFDEGLGEGPQLYVGGSFSTAGQQSANHIAKWNGVRWIPLGPGWSQSVFALAVYDDDLGDGPQLYAGGWFSSWPDGSGTLAKWRPCPPIPGDLNGDGCVNQSDLGSLLASYGVDGGGDIDGDGDTDQADLGALLSNYDGGC
jgi:hypothetical protein